MPAPTNAPNADSELVFTRLLAAPAAVVFEAFTDPRHLVNWWGPNGFSTTIDELDVRPGGHWRLVMHGPDGRDYRNHIVFVEVQKPVSIVYKQVPEPGTEPVSFEVTITFEPRGVQTFLTMRMVFPSAANRDWVVKTYGADEGGKQTLSRLADYIRAKSPSVTKQLRLERDFAAPPELVFRAWTDPVMLAQWWGPKGFTNPVCEVDPRPQGRIYIVMRAPDGTEFPMDGEFLEVTPPQCLVMLTRLREADDSVRAEIVNTVTFTALAQGGTRLTIVARVQAATEAAIPNLAGMEMGWSMSLDRLEKLVS